MLKYIPIIILVNSISISQEIVNPFSENKILKYRLFHTPPKPLFKSQTHFLDFVTDIPKDSVNEAILFFKTNNMENYREFSLLGTHGLYRFKYDPKIYPGKSIQYYFVLKSGPDIYATPLNSQGELIPVNKRFLDPVQYYMQRARMNK